MTWEERYREERIRRIQAREYIRTGRLMRRDKAEAILEEGDREAERLKERFPDGPEWRVRCWACGRR
ncbi:MAG: hypothetical protein PHZ19_06030 [Candidatus Thermoplasmatota archaeon]|nr:hypothetical protein [Candidatus Thermoplasmatota archaeon]